MDPSVLYTASNRRRFPKPDRERHPFSAALSLAGVVCLLIALVEPRWSSRGDATCAAASGCLNYLGLFGNDYRQEPYNSSKENKYLVASTIFCCLMAVVWLASAFILSMGYPRQRLACMRHNAIGNILGVLCSVMSCSLWFWCTSNFGRLKDYESLTFDVSFYLVVSAASCAVVASAINLLRFKPRTQSSFADALATSEAALLTNFEQDDDPPPPPPPVATLPEYRP